MKSFRRGNAAMEVPTSILETRRRPLRSTADPTDRSQLGSLWSNQSHGAYSWMRDRRCSAYQEVLSHPPSRVPNVHYRVNKSSPVMAVLSYKRPVHEFPLSFETYLHITKRRLKAVKVGGHPLLRNGAVSTFLQRQRLEK
jgi:hypothetical protein